MRPFRAALAVLVADTLLHVAVRAQAPVAEPAFDVVSRGPMAASR